MKKILTLFVVILAGLSVYVAISPKIEEKTESNVSVYQELQDGVSMETDIVYEETSKNQCILDIAWQKTGEKKPLLALVHGGSWTSGDKKDMHDLFYTYSAQGYVVANLNYELIDPKDIDTSRLHTITGQIKNISNAMEWIVGHADKYEIDPERIYLAGHSAGGQLAGALAEQQSLDPENYGYSIKGLMLLSAATDLRQFLYSDTNSGNLELSFVELSFMFDGNYESDVITELNKVDVLTNIHSNMPSTLLVHGNFDSTIPYHNSEETYKKMHGAGVSSRLVIIPEMEHSMNIQLVCNAISAYLKEQGEE